MKKIILIIVTILLITGCRKTDSILFKQEFENENYSSSIKLSIPSDNSFNYITDFDLVKKIEYKEDIIVLFGNSKSKETRYLIDNLLKVSSELNIDKIYYLDILEIRDEKEIENDEIKTIKQGTEDYNKLLELLNNYIKDYVVKGKVVGKRIYAGTILKINNGEITITNGVSENFDINNYNDNNKRETYDILYNFFKKDNVCNPNEGC